MAHSFIHAVSSARKFGGRPEDYLALHNWFDATKSHMADFRHRALRHHSEGVILAERIFGKTIKNQAGIEVPVRAVGTQHIKEDFNGASACVADWLKAMRLLPWMTGVAVDPTIQASLSARRFGGESAAYLPLHQFFEETRTSFGDCRHRALRHHSEGIFLAEQVFGVTLRRTRGVAIPTRIVAEQHVRACFRGRIPTPQDWLLRIKAEPWMHARQTATPTEAIYREQAVGLSVISGNANP